MQHLPPQERPDPLAPGPYAFADAERVRTDFGRSRFRENRGQRRTIRRSSSAHLRTRSSIARASVL
jgi:hypothetical protein